MGELGTYVRLLSPLTGLRTCMLNAPFHARLITRISASGNVRFTAQNGRLPAKPGFVLNHGFLPAAWAHLRGYWCRRCRRAGGHALITPQRSPCRLNLSALLSLCSPQVRRCPHRAASWPLPDYVAPLLTAPCTFKLVSRVSRPNGSFEP